jgi:hypothetical protein
MSMEAIVFGDTRRGKRHGFTIQDHGKHLLFLTVAGGLYLRHDRIVRSTTWSETWRDRNMEE